MVLFKIVIFLIIITCGAKKTVDKSIEQMVKQLQDMLDKKCIELETISTILDITVEIERIQRRSVPYYKMTRSKDALDEFKKWFSKQNGLYLHPDVTIFQDKYDRLGLTSTKELKSNTKIIHVRYNTSLSSFNSKKELEHYFNDIKDNNEIFQPTWINHGWLALKLIQERLNSTSIWTPYLNILPTNIAHALYFNKGQFNLLHGSEAYVEAAWLLIDMFGQYAFFYKQLIDNPQRAQLIGINKHSLTIDLFRWAFTVSITRTYEDIGGDYRLFPIADIINHGKPNVRLLLAAQNGICSKNNQYDTKNDNLNGYLRYHTNEMVKENTELLHQYADLKSLGMPQIFALWGMVEPNAILPITLIPSNLNSALGRLKRLKLHRRGYKSDQTIYIDPQPNPLHIWPTDLPVLLISSTGQWPSKQTKRTWQRMWFYVIRQIRLHLSNYRISTSYNQLNDNDLLVLQQLKTEQEILQKTMQQAMWLLLNGKPIRFNVNGYFESDQVLIVNRTIMMQQQNEKQTKFDKNTKKQIDKFAKEMDVDIPEDWTEEDINELKHHWIKE